MFNFDKKKLFYSFRIQKQNPSSARISEIAMTSNLTFLLHKASPRAQSRVIRTLATCAFQKNESHRPFLMPRNPVFVKKLRVFMF